MASLEGWGSTIELHPRVPAQRNGPPARPLARRRPHDVPGSAAQPGLQVIAPDHPRRLHGTPSWPGSVQSISTIWPARRPPEPAGRTEASTQHSPAGRVPRSGRGAAPRPTGRRSDRGAAAGHGGESLLPGRVLGKPDALPRRHGVCLPSLRSSGPMPGFRCHPRRTTCHRAGPQCVANPGLRRRAQCVLAAARLLVQEVRAAEADRYLGMVAEMDDGGRCASLPAAPARDVPVPFAVDAWAVIGRPLPRVTSSPRCCDGQARGSGPPPPPAAARRRRRDGPGAPPRLGRPRGVAQLGSAPALGAGGRGFKSRHPDARLLWAHIPPPDRPASLDS